MCDLRAGFRLCTCPDPDATPDWALQRHDPSLPPGRRRGKVRIHRPGASEQAQIAAALEALNGGSAFDFDHAPAEGEVLVLRVGEWRLRFRHQAGRWARDESTALAGWRDQMVPLRAGCLAKSDG